MIALVAIEHLNGGNIYGWLLVVMVMFYFQLQGQYVLNYLLQGTNDRREVYIYLLLIAFS